MNTTFKDSADVVKFLLDTDNWQDWEVVKLQASSNNGVSLTVNTRINDPAGIKNYQSLRKLRSTISSFMTENAGISIFMDIKMKLPDESKILFDVNSEYSNFFIDFFSGGSLFMVSTSQVELSKNASLIPAQTWEHFVQILVDKWKSSHNYIVTT